MIYFGVGGLMGGWVGFGEAGYGWFEGLCLKFRGVGNF